MMLNTKSSNTIIAGTVSILGVGILHILITFPLLILISILAGLIILTGFFIIYFQKTEKPVCKNCKKHMFCTHKTLLSQEEEIRNGQFVFLYKYEYIYKCDHCGEVVHINKIQKNKS